MAEETKKRKADHINIALRKQVQARQVTTGFEDVHLVHRALPEIDKEKISLETVVFEYKFAAPILIGAITGGTSKGLEINSTLAEAAEKLKLGMGVGSERAAIEDKSIEKTFSIARTKAPSAFLVANLGGVQLSRGYGKEEAKKAIKILEADALAVHLNALQEAVQPEGQTDFGGILPKLRELITAVEEPVIAKETGAGIGTEDAALLESVGVKGIDVSGAGGTSWAAVEYHRATPQLNASQRSLGNSFWDWGIPTALSVVEVARTVKVPVIASGGIRSGIDIAKAIALGASLASLSQPMLKAAVQGVGATEKSLTLLMDELKTAMFLTGAKCIQELKNVPVVVTGKTAEWLKTRGFSLEDFARRNGDQQS